MHGETEAEEQSPAGWVALVGAGPGDPGLLTVRAAELLGQAGLVVAGADLEPVARRHMSQDASLADPADGAGSARALVQAAKSGQLAIRLFNGDPLLSGAVQDATACAKAGVRFEIVPGVPTATAVPAYAGIPLASERNGELRVIHAAEASQLAYSPATLVVLGANAVRAVRERFEEYGLDARAFAGVKVAAVGEQTAASLLEFGIRPDLVPEGDQSAEGLAAAWPPYDDLLDPINRVLLPRADIATETLVARLTDLGWETEDVTAYRTVRAAPPPAPIREAIKGGGFDAVLFTSSSTVRNLIGIAGKPHAVTAVAVIGPQTAQTAAEYGLRVDVTATRPSATALVDALAEHGARLRDAALAAGEPVRRPSERRRGARRRIR